MTELSQKGIALQARLNEVTDEIFRITTKDDAYVLVGVGVGLIVGGAEQLIADGDHKGARNALQSALNTITLSMTGLLDGASVN